MKWKTQGVVCAIFVFFAHQLHSVSGKKTVKLIVPHKIKYIHHTHVLLVKPSKKASAKIQVPVEEEEEDSFQHLQYHDMPRHKGKTKVHYVMPYIAESKEGDVGYNVHDVKSNEDEEHVETYYVPVQNYRKGRTPIDEHPSNVNSRLHKRPAHHREVTAHTLRHPTRYLHPPDQEFMKALKSPMLGLGPAEQYEAKYMGSYSSYSDIEPSASSPSSAYAISNMPDTYLPKSYYVKENYQNYAPPYSYSKWVS